ncbi:MAG: hypothetical protein WBA10_08625 [Elainellaceae cyanobacterium]
MEPQPADSAPDAWYITKQPRGTCIIVSASAGFTPSETDEAQWGPFEAEADAIARRVGLIRAGKCKPA